MARPISLAMIVKDESEVLEECLTSVAGVADEICIVDTGSQDNTLEIAKRFNAKVSFFIWCDDFSAARNESLRQCTGDWIFVLDADERIAPEDLRRIRALSEGPPNVCYRFTTRNYTNAENVSEFERCAIDDPNAKGFAGWYPSHKIRFFPNRVGARFEGQVHETVHRSLEGRNIKVLESDTPVHHYPFLKTPERILAKQELYLELGLKKIEACPKDAHAYEELGNQYAEVRDYASAAAAYRQSLRLAPSNANVIKDLGGVLHLIKRSEEAKRALKLALKLDPSLAEAWRNLGVIYADEKEWALSIECFQNGLALDDTWSDGHRYLSVALEGAGRNEEAAQEARFALEKAPDSSAALRMYLHLMLRLERRGEAREFLLEIVESNQSVPAIHNALGELYFYDDLLDHAKDHFQKAGEAGVASAYNNLGVVLYREKRYKESVVAFEQCLASEPGHRGARANIDKAMTKLSKPD